MCYNLGGDEYDPSEEAMLQSMIVGGAFGRGATLGAVGSPAVPGAAAFRPARRA